MPQDRLDSNAIATKYRAAIATYRRQLADPNLRLSFEQEVDAFFRRCALSIWARGNGLTQNHMNTYNTICSGANRPAKMLYLELCAAVEEPPVFTPPGFYAQLVSADRGTRRNRAGQFCELCRLVFLLFAAADDTMSPKAVEYGRACVNQLLEAAGKPPASQTERPEDIQPGQPEQPAVAGPAAEAEAAQGESKEEEPQPTLEELMEELNSLCGLDRVKKDVNSLVNLVKIRKLREEQGLPIPPMSLHLVFMGNPGTGKTTVARLLAGIYRAIGVLPKGQLIEVARSGLVAGYVGQTAIQTQKVIQSALGGILFIDEAYALASQPGGNDFGQEAIDTILKAMEDHRKELVVIVAGYTNLMNRFVHSNPGLESRFNKYLYFDDYEGEALESIFYSFCKKNGYEVEDKLKERLPKFFGDLYDNRDENFGNARDVRNLFEVLVSVQSDRVAQLENPTRDDLVYITVADFEQAERNENGDEEKGENESHIELKLESSEEASAEAPENEPEEDAETTSDPEPASEQ